MRGSRLLTLRTSVLTLIFFLLATGCGNNLESAVATVGDETITVDDLRQEMIRQFRTEKGAASKSLEQREKVLENLIERRLKVAGARAEGYFDRPEFKEKEATLLADAMINRLYEVKILEEVVTEKVMRDFYEKQGTEVDAAHLLIKWTTDSAAVRQRAQEISREIKGGLAFELAAERYTEEPGGKERKGDLGWFSWGRMVKEFQDACWALKDGEISAPVETRFGVHIIHLRGRRTVEDRPEFDEEKENVKNMCRQAMSAEIMEAGNAYLDKLKKDLGFKVDAAQLPTLLSDIQANLKPELRLTDIFHVLSQGAWRGKALATWKGGQMDLDGLMKGQERNFRPASSLTTPKDLEDLITNTSIFPMLSERAKKDGMDDDKDVKERVTQQLEGAVVMAYERERIKGEIKIADEQIQTYFDGHPEEFMHPQMVKVQEIHVADKGLAEQLAQRARKGENFGALAKEYTERPDRKGTDGSLEPFQAGRYGKMGEAAFNLEVGKISDPVPVGRNWSVVKLNEKIAPAPKSFEESKTSIRIKMEREERTRRQEAWRKEIETKVPVKIFKEKLSTLFADVEQDIKEDELSDRTDPKTGQLKRKSNGEPIKPEDY